MKIIHTSLLAFALCSAAAFSAEQGRSTTSIQWHDGVGEVLMHGPGSANMNGDKVELNNGVLYLNGQSYGAAANTSEIRYIVTASSRTLYVDGKARSPVPKK